MRDCAPAVSRPAGGITAIHCLAAPRAFPTHAAATAQINPITVNINNATAEFTLTLPSEWPGLTIGSGGAGVLVNGQWLSTANGGLVFDGTIGNDSFVDAWGPGTIFTAAYRSSSTGNDVMYAMWRVYDNVPAVVFEQYLPAGIAATGGNYSNRDSLTTAWPTFAAPPASTGVGIMHYEGAVPPPPRRVGAHAGGGNAG